MICVGICKWKKEEIKTALALGIVRDTESAVSARNIIRHTEIKLLVGSSFINKCCLDLL